MIGIMTGYLIAVLLVASSSAAGERERVEFRQYRSTMVERQLEARGITDPQVLEAMRKVERHLFVPEKYRPLAYTDGPLPISHDQTISQPYIVALMTQLLELKPTDRVLEIGTGSGYQAAILGEIATEVFSIEIVEPLGHRADSLLDSLGYANVTVRIGDGYLGWPEMAPFDAIILTAAPPQIPQPLLDQLADGGRLVAPVGKDFQVLKLIQKIDNQLKSQDITGVRFVPMTGQAQEEPPD